MWRTGALDVGRAHGALGARLAGWFVAQHSGPAWLAGAFPGLVARAVPASRVRTALAAILAHPTDPASTLVRPGTVAVLVVAFGRAQRDMAEDARPTRVADAFQRLGAVSVQASWQGLALVALGALPAEPAAALSWLLAVAPGRMASLTAHGPVAEEAVPSGQAVALEARVAGAMHASGHGRAAVAAGSLPAHAAQALAGFLAEAVLGVAALGAHGLLALGAGPAVHALLGTAVEAAEPRPLFAGTRAALAAVGAHVAFDARDPVVDLEAREATVLPGDAHRQGLVQHEAPHQRAQLRAAVVVGASLNPAFRNVQHAAGQLEEPLGGAQASEPVYQGAPRAVPEGCVGSCEG